MYTKTLAAKKLRARVGRTEEDLIVRARPPRGGDPWWARDLSARSKNYKLPAPLLASNRSKLILDHSFVPFSSTSSRFQRNLSPTPNSSQECVEGYRTSGYFYASRLRPWLSQPCELAQTETRTLKITLRQFRPAPAAAPRATVARFPREMGYLIATAPLVRNDTRIGAFRIANEHRSHRRWSLPPMNTCNSIGVTNALPFSWKRKEYTSNGREIGMTEADEN
ncbi:hypothetical protein EVAR_52576_1 [Eumeta japonica]|uniref:Uncharacterized protein n=1 Tax=Eumeta variegata TaxID=151549 RepID=A0A4C1YER5_EUMVA|nr:hypothetical protein EVAR_52576_1 [Eumeta japonica]